MTKTTQTYWNPLKPENKDQWQPIEVMEGFAEELTLSLDNETGEYTRLTRFQPGADTASFGAKTISIQKKFLLSVVAYMMRLLISGWKRGIMQVDRQANFMDLLKLKKAVSCLRFLFLIKSNSYTSHGHGCGFLPVAFCR